MKPIILTILALCLSCTAYAKPVEFNDDNCIKALIGEAGGQSYEELYAHACALRNRGTLKGVYGLYSKQVSKASAETWQKASRAWHESEHGYDPTLGATHWLSEYDLKHCKPERLAWAKSMDRTAKVGQTNFFREKGYKRK